MRRTNCGDDEVLQELRNGLSAGHRFRCERRTLDSWRLTVDQCVFRFFTRAEDVAHYSIADFFTDPVGRASIFCSHRHRVDGSTAQRAETFTVRADCDSAWLFSASAVPTDADESVIRITTAGSSAGSAKRVAYFKDAG